MTKRNYLSTTYDISQGAESHTLRFDTDGDDIDRCQKYDFLNHFKYVRTNIPGPGSDREQFSEQYSGCDCEGPCTPGSCSCLDLFGQAYTSDGKLIVNEEETSRPILECGIDCSCDPLDCCNRVVQRGITTDFYVFITEYKGFGLKLRQDVSACSFVCEYAGEVISHSEAIKRVQQNEDLNRDNYVIALRENVGGKQTCTYIDPSIIGNLGRFINHSCDPNLVMMPVRINHPIPRLALFSRRTLTAGEELTFDYSGKASFIHDHINRTSTVSVDCEQSNLTDKQEPTFKKHMLNHPIDDNRNDLNHQNTREETGQTNKKLCLCKSYNCQYYLPFDENLLLLKR